MKRISDGRVCFTVSLEEVIKYGLCPFEQLKRNPEVKLLFPKKSGRGEEVMSAKEIPKRNDVLHRSIPSRCKGLLFTWPKFCLLISSY